MDKVVRFEIPVDNMERAKVFYVTCFKWMFDTNEETNYTFIKTAESDGNVPKELGVINGRMIQRDENQPVPTIVISVEDIHDTVEKVKGAGGNVFTGVFNVGMMGLCALFKDTEGNLMGLWQSFSQ